MLDLGSAVGSNVEFLSQYGCKLFIEDLYAALSTRTPAGDGELAGPSFFAEFLALPGGDPLRRGPRLGPLRLSPAQGARRLLRAAADLTNRGALIFALISYHKTIPAQPYRFRIQDEQHLIYERRTAAERPSPRLAPAEVTDLLKGFRVDRSFLLKHGIQEYLLVREYGAGLEVPVPRSFPSRPPRSRRKARQSSVWQPEGFEEELLLIRSFTRLPEIWAACTMLVACSTCVLLLVAIAK